MDEKSQNLLKCKTKSNKKAELNNILTPGTTPKTPVNFRIKKKNQHDPAKTHEKRRNWTYYIKRRKSNDKTLPQSAINQTRKSNKERKKFQMGRGLEVWRKNKV